MIVARALNGIVFQGDSMDLVVELFDTNGDNIAALADEDTDVTLRIQRNVEDLDPIVDDVAMQVVSNQTVSYRLVVGEDWLGYYLGQITLVTPGIGPGAADLIQRSAPFTFKVAPTLSGS